MKSILAADDKARWLRRRTNRLKLALAYRLKSTVVPGLPRLLMIEPTNLCNLRCPLCPTGNGTLQRPKGRMVFDLYRRILAELDGAMERLILYNYGEPFLHPQIFEMIALARQSEIHTRVSTNGLVFDDARGIDALIASQLDHLRVCIDGATPETHQMYRVGSRLESVLVGVEQLLQRQRTLGRKRSRVELQFIAMRQNQHELPAIRRLAGSLGVPLRIKSVGLGNLRKAPERSRWLPEAGSLRRYEWSAGRLELNEEGAPRRVCDHPWERLVINWDGEATACCYDHEGHFAFGNAAGGIGRLWNGAGLQALRQALRHGDPPEICRGCPSVLWNSPRMAVVEGR